MTEKELQVLLPVLYNHRLKGQTDRRIDALIRMYVAIHDLICSTSLYDFESRSRAVRKINALFQVLDRTTIKGLCRMYRLTKEVALAVYGEKDLACRALYRELIGRYMKSPDASQETDVMQCIVYELGNVLDGNTELDYYEFFRNRSRRWISELTVDGCWSGLPPEAALRRIDILQYNYYAFRDESLNDAVLRAFHFYKMHLTLPTKAAAEDLPWLGAWYDLLRTPGLLPEEPGLLKQLARLFDDFAATAEYHSDGWYVATSYAVVECCAGIMAEMERKILQRIA